MKAVQILAHTTLSMNTPEEKKESKDYYQNKERQHVSESHRDKCASWEGS